MKNVLFIINTEGHLLTTASLIFEKFNKAAGYQPYVLQVSKNGTARFKTEKDQDYLTEKYIDIDPWTKGFVAEMQEILDTKFERVFIFLEQLALNLYLANKFKKQGSIICLTPDGNKPYFSVDKLALGSRVRQTIHTYRYLFSNKLYYFKPYFLSWNYAKINPIDEIWVTFPEKFTQAKKKHKVVGFTILPTEAVANQVKRFFKIDITLQLKHTNGVIFYTNNILSTQQLYEAEIDIITKLKQRYPEAPFYLKYHPSTPAHQIEKFKALELNCFCDSIPAELYIASLHHSIIIGMWSASLMVNNPKCKFYWLYDYLLKEKIMTKDTVNLVNPTPHIQDVDRLDAVVF
jgi:hypothetical protein